MPRQGDPELLKRIGQRLTKSRVKKGLSKAAVARELEMSRAQTLQDWEDGKANFSIFDLAKLCELYGVSCDWVLELSESPTIHPGHSVIDVALETEVLAARSAKDVDAALKRANALTEFDPSATGAVQIGYELPRGFVVVTNEAFEDRRKAVADHLKKFDIKPRSILQRLGLRKKGGGASDG